MGRSLIAALALLLSAAPLAPARACSPDDFPSLAEAAPAARSAAPASGPPAAALAGGPWSNAGALATPRQEVAVAELNGKIWVVGGIDGAPSFLASVEVYDPASDSFSAGPPLPVPLHHTTASAVDGKLYVIGGWSDYFATPQALVLEHDPQVGGWSVRAPMPTARGSPAAAVLDGKIYVAGGWPLARSQDFAAYDPSANTWQTLPDLPSGRNHLALAAAGGKLYAVGGRTALQAGVGNVADVDVFDPDTGVWSPAAALPRARGGLAATAVGRRVFAFGGEGNAASPDGTFEDADVYDPLLDAWTALAPMPTPRHGIGAAAWNGRIHIPGGGPVENFSVTDVHEVLHVASALGLPVPALPALAALGLAAALALGARRALSARGRGRSAGA